MRTCGGHPLCDGRLRLGKEKKKEERKKERKKEEETTG